MEHGVIVSGNKTDYEMYYDAVMADVKELRQYYPFSKRILIPSVKPGPIELDVIGVDAGYLEKTGATETDFIDEFSRRLHIVIPYDYQEKGCLVYGGKWIDYSSIPSSQKHFNDRLADGTLLFCVGVPQSFAKLSNVILENIKTADNMLTAYQLLQTGQTKTLNLISYKHGAKGCNEYDKDKKKYEG